MPDHPLVSLLPTAVDSRADGIGASTVGATLCRLPTDIADPLRRLRSMEEPLGDSEKVISSLPALAGDVLSGGPC
ncbi:hypothetical protein [Nocardia wallacei]|uniref:hypothetical protein n=1 Tax=Nocardia wallacei TaxID=480035 RepID=UPI002456778A|nr:hypothetical protein [Nocardia wallacei]